MKAKKAVKKTKHVRAHVYYHGRVQGVGFRFTAEKLALEHALLGWVKNLPDGSVELVCEGDRSVIEKFFKSIQDSMLGRHIKKVQCDWSKATGEFTDFQIEYIL